MIDNFHDFSVHSAQSYYEKLLEYLKVKPEDIDSDGKIRIKGAINFVIHSQNRNLVTVSASINIFARNKETIEINIESLKKFFECYKSLHNLEIDAIVSDEILHTLPHKISSLKLVQSNFKSIKSRHISKISIDDVIDSDINVTKFGTTHLYLKNCKNCKITQSIEYPELNSQIIIIDCENLEYGNEFYYCSIVLSKLSKTKYPKSANYVIPMQPTQKKNFLFKLAIALSNVSKESIDSGSHVRIEMKDNIAELFYEIVNNYPDKLSDDNWIEILQKYHKKLSNDSYQYILHLLPEDKRDIVKPHTFKNKFKL